MFSVVRPLRPLLILTLMLAIMAGLARAQPPQTADDVPLSAKIAAPVAKALKNDGAAEFIITLSTQADLSGAAQLASKAAKGQYVFDALRAHAARTQAPIRALLDAQGVAYQPFYISNKIYVPTGARQLVTALAARPDVATIDANNVYQLPEPLRSAKPLASPLAIEPNLTFINADDVWALGITGDGVVLAGNDTGIQWDHPALRDRYRGWDGSTADHNYSWWDATGTYPAAPGDGHGHGTHTTGTMVGSDGGENQIGVAPGARTIHCKNLDDGGSGSDADIIECFQWDLAPWDLSGNNPRPALAPDVINNSWGGGGGNAVFMNEIDALQAAGILVEFSAGNNGPACNSLGSPGDFPQVLTTGSVGHSGGTLPGSVTAFSSRGPSPFTAEPLPDIMAPGENIRSSMPGGSYAEMSGTSMSGPHVTALVGLLWSANPGLRGFIAETQQLIIQTAVPLSGQFGSNCGGDYTDGPNNDWGHGTIDALAAVNAALLFGDPGVLAGRVRDAASQAPLADVSVRAALSPDLGWRRMTDDNGLYHLVVFSGTYTVSATLYGYVPQTLPNVTVTAGQTTTLDFDLAPAPFYTVSGRVYDPATGWPLYAQIAIAGYPGAPIWSDPLTGDYSVSLAAGIPYTFNVTPWAGGYGAQAQPVGPLTADSQIDLALAADPALCVAPGYQPDYLLFNNFEADDGGLTVEGQNPSWQWGQPTSGPRSAYSGTNVWATNLSGDYNNSETGYLVSPVIDMSAYSGATTLFTWWQWLQTEPCCDYLTLDISPDGGTNWYTAYYATEGTPTGWQKRSVFLEPWLLTSTFRYRFTLGSDGSITFPGAYIDDVGIGLVNRPPTYFNTDFEADDGGFVAAGARSTWEWGVPTRGPGGAHSGLNGWATNLDGNYRNNEHSTLTSPLIDVSAALGRPLLISWWQWLQSEPSYDTLTVEVSGDDGATWTPVLGPLSGPLDGGWNPYSVYLDPTLVAPTLRVRFRFDSDYTVTFPGFYLDDFQVADWDEAPPALTCNVPGGGLVVGHVRDANTGSGLNGSRVYSTAATTLSRATPGDPAVDDGLFVLYADSGPQTIAARAADYADGSAAVTISSGATHPRDLSLAAGQLVADPPALGVTLAMGASADQTLTLRNAGALDLAFALRERSGDFQPLAAPQAGVGRWLYRAAAGVPLAANGADAALAWPSAYRWQPTAPTADLNILVYTDDAVHRAPNTLIDGALRALGLSYTAHYDGDFGGFQSSLTGGTPWDVVIFANENFFPPDGVLNDLADWVAGGGRLIAHSWVVGALPNAPLWDALGVTWRGNDTDPPNPVYWWQPTHPAFNLPQPVPELTSPQNIQYEVYGQQVEPHAAAQALAGYVAGAPQPDQAALVLGNDGRTLFKGFVDASHSSDLDGNGTADLQQLWINLIDGIQNEFVFDITWLSTDIISGTLTAGDSVAISVGYDAGVDAIAQPGNYRAALRFANDTPYGALSVPITLTVAPPADWGRVGGSVSGLAHCDAAGGPLAAARVTIADVAALATGGDGAYGYWLPAGTYSVTVAHQGYLTQTFGVDVAAGGLAQHNVALRPLRPCGTTDPASISGSAPQRGSSTHTLTLHNAGAAALRYTLLELPAQAAAPRGLPALPPAGAADRYSAARSGPTALAGRAPGAAPAPRAALSGWFGAADLPVGLVRYAAAQCPETPDQFYVIAGVDATFSLSAQMWRFDGATNSWTALAPIPAGQEAPVAVCDQGRIYVLGGSGTNQLYIYDIALDTWLAGSALPRNVAGAAVGVWQGRIYLAGGDDDFAPGTGVADDVNIYDIASDTWVGTGAPLPVATSNAGYAQVGRYLYIVGGWGEQAPAANVDATQRYDMQSDTWQSGASFSSQRSDFALAVTDRALYAIGGDADGGGFFEATAHVERLDLTAWPDAAWTATGDPLPVATTSNSAGFCTAALFNAGRSEIWSVGGFSGGAIGGRAAFRELADERCVTPYGDVPWLHVTLPAGDVAADSQHALTVTLDAADLAAGTYHATLVVASNDRLLRVPVTFEVAARYYYWLPLVVTAP